MTIRYGNGSTIEGVLLSRTDDSMRVAIRDSDDVAAFREIDGAWFAEDGQPVEIEYAWMRRKSQSIPVAEECVCSQEMASRLVRLLFAGDTRESIPVKVASAGACPWAP